MPSSSVTFYVAAILITSAVDFGQSRVGGAERSETRHPPIVKPETKPEHKKTAAKTNNREKE